MLEYREINRNPKGRKTGDCVTRALCGLLGCTYEKALDLQVEYAKKYCKMKANKSPEKIYLQEPTKVRTKRLYNNDIEYTQTDAFIEKAWQWIFWMFVVAAPFEFQQGIEKEFRKEMKGE